MIYEFDESGRTQGYGQPAQLGATSQGVRRYYTYFDGNSYIALPAASYSAGQQLVISFNTNRIVNGPYKRFLGASDYSVSVDTGNNGRVFKLAGVTAEFDGVPVVSRVTALPEDNQWHELVVRLSASFHGVLELGGLSVSAGKRVNAYFRECQIVGVAKYRMDTNAYPSLVFEDSLGNNDAQGYNFQPSSFVQELP